MHEDEAVLLRVADALASGAAVDWKALPTDGAVARRLSRLRLIESIRDAHRATLTDSESRQAPAGEPLPFTRWGAFEVFERIGGGRFGDVYRATDTRLDKDVALKLLSPRANGEEQDSLKEARQQARVSHPNVLLIHGVDRHEGRIGLWSELIEGQTLEERLAAGGAFGADEAAQIGIVLCQALAAVHGAGLVHGDVKATNVMREVGGRIVLMDFSSVSDADPLHRECGGGTPAYMAPEVFSGEAAPSVRADLYSLGVLLYRLVSAQYPIRAASVLELHEKHRRGEVIPLRDVRPDLSPGFIRVVERALSADPQRRYASAGEMESALATIGDAPVRPGTMSRRVAAFAAVAALVLIAAAIVIPRLVSAPFQVEVELWRTRGDRQERLASTGGVIHEGDQLELAIESSVPIYAYVIVADARQPQAVQFPSMQLDLRNPLRAGREHRLPGTRGGITNRWRIDDTVGTETYTIVAAREPIAGLEQLAAAADASASGPVPIDPRRLSGPLRGVELTEASGPPRPAAELIEEEMSRRAGISRQVFVLDHRPSGSGS